MCVSVSLVPRPSQLFQRTRVYVEKAAKAWVRGYVSVLMEFVYAILACSLYLIAELSMDEEDATPYHAHHTKNNDEGEGSNSNDGKNV